ncbi:hypothetical protein QJQ45_004367 [Haematococcus lacustris]|nr:hypothetical protein QJQ45_004367 [Haematococcus lacustris]
MLHPGGKAQLVELVREQRMCMFMATWQKGHGATQFPIWYSSPWPYTVQHNSMFEPWYLVDRFRNPWYDARIRGYGLDKQQQVTAAALDRKLTFMVHPTAFVVHMPHEKSQTFRQYMSAVAARKAPIGDHVKQVLASMHSQALEATHKPTASNLSVAEVGVIMRKQNEELFHASERHMRRGGSNPSHLDPQVQACLSELPWWQAQPAVESATQLNPARLS